MKFTQILAGKFFYIMLTQPEKRATENFVQELIFRLADIIIVVVNDLTTPEQVSLG